MKHLQMLVVSVFVALGLLAGAGQPGQSAPARRLASSPCTDITLQGRYEFLAPATVHIGAGTVIAVPERLLYASPAVYGSKGTLTFDGTGHVLLTVDPTAQGPLAESAVYEGTYTMKGDCTATATFANNTQLGLKWMNSDDAPYLVSTKPGFVILRPAPAGKAVRSAVQIDEMKSS